MCVSVCAHLCKNKYRRNLQGKSETNGIIYLQEMEGQVGAGQKEWGEWGLGRRDEGQVTHL